MRWARGSTPETEARYRWPVVPASFHDFYSGCASVAGALIGLLFVALSVSQEKLTGDDVRTEHQVRAAGPAPDPAARADRDEEGQPGEPA